MRGILIFLVMHQCVAFAGGVVLIWPGTSRTGTIQIRARVRPKTQMTIAASDAASQSQRVVIEKKITRGITQKSATITPF